MSLIHMGKVVLASVGSALRITPNGALLFHDIRMRLPHENIRIIFDIGANVGQTAHKLRIAYPQAKIYCFEPSPKTFKQLRKSIRRHKNIVPINIGFGAKSERVRFDCAGHSETGHIAYDQADNSHPLVDITTLDEFCSIHNIDELQYLKIDTEGHDLDVLKGSIGLLTASKIGIVVTECTLDPDNTYHVQFTAIHEFMCRLGYRVFGFYEQTEEFYKNLPHLRRVNAAYISPSVINRPDTLTPLGATGNAR